ncbi:hypothetical protein F442_13125 [Phytophthora nicotianae P10297]|uniref:Uncharacterized protein n=1 Tax=Phytophthora nicotianae P10297 TaxID=1317064 RepID=W2YWL7_PHYNI|nr:hypothetical protein F442_13125 [Phytophthora nicotianae P10297]
MHGLFDFNEVTKALQDPISTLVGVRRAFDWVSRQYSAMRGRLAFDSAVVNYPALETDITKIITDGCLATLEQEACKSFKASPGAPPTDETTCSILGPSFRKRPQRVLRTYLCRGYLLRLMSAKLVYTDMRKNMDVNTLEVLMFLSYNRDAWDVGSVN